MGKIEKIIKKGPVEGQTTEVYPVTSTKAVYDENNKRLDNIITGLQESVYLNTPIPISTDNTPESMAQNVKNISDYVEKAKAAGIADVNGMGVTCLIDDYFSGVGYIMGNTDVLIQGIKIPDDIVDNTVFTILDGRYDERVIVGVDEANKVTSNMLVQGARKPIILTPDTTEVDEETYQKLLSNDVDVVFYTDTAEPNFCTLTYKRNEENALILFFTCLSLEGDPIEDSYIYAYKVSITKVIPHTCSIINNTSDGFKTFIEDLGYLNKSTLSPVLQQVEIFDDNTIESKQKNIDNLNAYKTNLEYLGVDTSKSFQVPVQIGGYYVGVLYFSYDTEAYKGIYTVSDLNELYYFGITSNGEYYERQVVLQGDSIGSDMLDNAAVTIDKLALNAKPFTMTSTLPTTEEWGQIFEISSKMNYRFLVPVYYGTTRGIHIEGQAATGKITRHLSAYVVTQYQDTENYTVLMVFQGVTFSFRDAGAYPFLQDNIVYRYLYVRNGRPTNFVDKTDVKGATAMLSEGLISQSPDYISGKKVNLPQTFGKGSMLYNGNTLWAEVPSLSQVQYDAILAKFKEKFPDTLVGFDRAYREVGSGQKVLIGDDISGITAIISSSYLFFL